MYDYADDKAQVLHWFTDNYMQENPSKFQYILFRSDDKLPDNNVLHIQDVMESCINLLGVDVDELLSFKGHLSRKQAGS